MFKIQSIVLLVLTVYSWSSSADDLLTVYQQALQSAPQLKAAGFKQDVGNAEAGQALGQMLPQVSGTANWSTNNLQQPGFIESYKGTRYFVSLTQSIMDFGKFWEWQRTKKQERQYDAELEEAQQILILDVVKRYFAILDAEDQLNLIKQERQATESYLLQLNKQFAKQLAKITDVYEMEARMDQLKADEIEAESAMLTTREALNELTATPYSNLSRLKDGVDYQELQGDLSHWIDVAKSESPALVAQRTAIEVASDNVSVQRSKYLPVVDLQLYFYDTNTGYQSVLINQTKTQVAAINVNVPIFTGGTTTQRVNEAQGTLEIKREEHEGKLRSLTKETSEAYTLSNANAKRIRASAKAVESAGKSVEAMQRGFKFGTVTIRDVINAQQAEFKARRELAKAKYNYIVNRVRFLKAIGTVNEGNLQEINQWLLMG